MVWAICVIVVVCSSVKCVKNISWPWLSPLPDWDSLTKVFLGKSGYLYIKRKAEIERTSRRNEKKGTFFEKQFRLSTHVFLNSFHLILLKTNTQNLFINFYSWFETKD